MAARNEDDIKNEKLSQSYAEARKKLQVEQEARLSRIADKQQKLLKIQNQSYDTEEEYNRLLEKEEKLQKEILDIQKESQDVLEDIDDLEERTNKTRKKAVDLVRERFENEEKIQDRLDDQNIALTLNEKAQQRLTGAAKDYSETYDISSKIIQQQVLTTGRIAGIQRQGVDLSASFLSNLQKSDEISDSLKTIQQDITSSVEDAAVGEYKKQDFSKANAVLDERRVRLAAERAKVGTDLATMDERELQILEDQIKADEQHLQELIDQDAVMQTASKQAEKTLGVYNKLLEGDFSGALRKQFSMDEIQSDIKKKLGGSLVNVIKEVKAGNIGGAFSAAGEGLKSMISMGPKLLAALGIGAILMLGKFLLDTFMKADQEVADLGKNFGISKNEAKELHHTAVDVANEMGVVGIHSEQIAKGLEQVSQNLGGIDLTGAFSSGNAAVQQMVKDTTLLTEKFGLSAEEAGNMSNIAAITGTSVGELSMKASTLGKGIFSAKESMKILAGIPKSIVSQMAKMPEAMIKTAMNAKMLGMNMKQIADIGRKSLDIEQSLEAEMEARALIGKDINLDAMRAAALNGDQETVMNELLKTAGSMEDFNKMNVLQKEALAKAAGMEVDQMAEMLGKQEELNKAGLSQAKVQELQSKNAEELAALASSENNENKKAYLEKLAAEKKSESTQAAMASLMQRLQELAVKLVTPLMDMVDAFLNGQDGADAMGGIINGIGGVIKTIVPVIKVVASVIGSILGPLGSILGMFGQTEDTAKGVSEGVSKVSEAVKPVEAGFGGILKVVGAIGAFFIGKSLLGKGLDMLKDKAADVGQTIMTKVGGPLGKIGGKLFGGGKKEEAGGGGGGDTANVATAEKGKNMVSGILDKMKSIIDSIKGVVQSAIGFVRDVGKDLLATLNDVVKGIGDILKTGADIIVNVGTKLAEGAMKILNIIMEGLAKAANTLPTIMGALGKAVVAFFQPMAALVNPMVIGGIIIFTAAMIGLGYAFKLLGEGIGAAAPGITAFFDGVGGVIETVGEVIAKVIETITTSIIRLQDINGDKLLGTAAGIVAIGGAMAALGAGKAAEGFGSFVGSLFGGGDDPMEKLISFTERMKPEKLAETSNGLKALTSTFSSFATAIETMAASLDKLNLDKLDAAIEKLEKAKKLNDMSVGEGIAAAAESFVGGITSIFGLPEKQSAQPVAAGAGGGGVVADGGGTNMANVEKKLDTLISVISQAANQPMVIKFGEKTIEEIKSQLNFRKGTSIGVNKTYGKTTE